MTEFEKWFLIKEIEDTKEKIEKLEEILKNEKTEKDNLMSYDEFIKEKGL